MYQNEAYYLGKTLCNVELHGACFLCLKFFFFTLSQCEVSGVPFLARSLRPMLVCCFNHLSHCSVVVLLVRLLFV